MSSTVTMNRMTYLKDPDGIIVAEVVRNPDGEVLSVKTWNDDLTETEWMPVVSTKPVQSRISKSGKRTEESMHEGWKNYSTWNVALHLANDEPLYREVVRFMKDYKGDKPYLAFCRRFNLSDSKTPDLIKWTGTKLDYKALDEYMWEFSPKGSRS